MAEHDATAGEQTGADALSEVGAGDEATRLVARVAAHDESLAAEVVTLQAQLAELESERDDLVERLQRTQADFQNYKKRAKKRQEQIRETATEDLVEDLLDVRDNLGRALDQDEGADIRSGVEATLREFDRVLEDEGVEAVDPDPGEEVDPQRHEVLMRVESDAPADSIAEVYRPGYEMGDKVLRPAQVTVSEE